MPAECLVGIKELFTMPAFWVILNGFINAGVMGGAEESLQRVIPLAFSAALDGLPVRSIMSVFRSIRTFGSGIANPVMFKSVIG